MSKHCLHSYQEGGSKAVHIQIGQTVVQICSLLLWALLTLLSSVTIYHEETSTICALQNITLVQSITDIKTEKKGKKWEGH